MPDGSSATTGSQTKLERVIGKYDLSDFGEELVDRWLGQNGYERESLRSLASVTNARILQSALEHADETPLEGEVDNLVRLLTSDDVSAGMRSQTRQRLEQLGIDVDDLTTDFVSHQAIHTYLTSVREVKYESDSSPDDKLTDRLETIQRLESRLQAVTESTIEQLPSDDEFSVGSIDVIASVQVLCNDCGQQYTIQELIEQNGCGC